MHKIEQNVKFSDGIPVAATYRTAAAVTGVGVDMAKYNNYAAIITVAGATQWQGALTVVIAESTDNATFSTTYLATVTVATATTVQVDAVEISDEKMSDGYRYLRAEATPAAGTGNLFAIVNARFNPRYAAV